MIWLHSKTVLLTLLATAITVVDASKVKQHHLLDKMDSRVKAHIQKRAANKLERQPDALSKYTAASGTTTKYAGIYEYAGTTCAANEAYEGIVYPTQVCQPVVVDGEQYAIEYLCSKLFCSPTCRATDG